MILYRRRLIKRRGLYSPTT